MSTPMPGPRAAWLAVTSGAWLASVQVALVLVAGAHLSAVWWVYAAVVLAWLVGSLLTLSTERGALPTWVGAALVASYAAAWMLQAIDRDAALFPVIVAAVLGGGAAGRLFTTLRRQFHSAGYLFGWENSGFLLGWIMATLAWLTAGQGGLLFAPLLWYAAMAPMLCGLAADGHASP
jgi:hypothetical protein